MKTTTVKNLFLILTIVGSFVLAQRVFGAAAVTQESARVPYRTRGVYGQSFTAPDTGTITRIEVYLAASGRSTNLRIYAGERSPNRPGAAVYVQNGIPIVCSDCWLSVPLVTPVSVKAGARYTFEFTDVAPYANPGNPYAGGQAWIKGVSSASTDLGFRISLGASLAGHGNGDEATGGPSAKDAARLRLFLGRATTYAHQQGALVVAAAGNDAIDLDHTGSLAVVPAQSPHVLAVSALGPLGWALGSAGFDRPASYSNFGQSAIAFGAPGGDFALPGNDPCSMSTLAGPVAQPCWVFDLVLSAVRGGDNASYGWSAGTSMAAPAAAGVAALIVGKFGRIGPARVEAKLRSSADDLGKPGNDDAFGMGRVNAFRAIR